MAAKKRKRIPCFHEKVPCCASMSGQNSLVFLHVRVLMFTCSSETNMSNLWLISGEYEAASNEHQCPIVTLPSEWHQTSLFSLFLKSQTFPVKRLSSGLWTLCSGTPREELLICKSFYCQYIFPLLERSLFSPLYAQSRAVFCSLSCFVSVFGS